MGYMKYDHIFHYCKREIKNKIYTVNFLYYSWGFGREGFILHEMKYATAGFRGVCVVKITSKPQLGFICIENYIICDKEQKWNYVFLWRKLISDYFVTTTSRTTDLNVTRKN